MMMNCDHFRYPVGIQSFPEIREGGYVYVDKTASVYQLIREGKYYFLSRPRRFGKSLLLSTIEAYYQGRRELFKGLALDSLTEDWDSHPILHLDLNSENFEIETALDRLLDYQLNEWESRYGIDEKDRDGDLSLSIRFRQVIEKAHEKTGKKVVVLVDEYDKPMLSAIDNEKLADKYRNTLKAFYGNLKSMDAHIEFAMLTGVARFSKVSIFSDLNNLRDISFQPKFSTICGITPEELNQYFTPGIKCLADRYGKSFDDMKEELKRRYDGYHFAENLQDIYNPFSLVNVFASEKLNNYWFDSGTPTYVVKLIKAGEWNLADIENFRIDAGRLGSEGIMSRDLIPTLYQAGYLTIREYDMAFDEYTLGYPNGEVEESFIKFLRPIFLGDMSRRSEFDNRNFVRDVLNGDPQAFMTRLYNMLRGVPHFGDDEPHEVFFRNIIYITFKLMGFHAHIEDHTSDGRIDLTVETTDFAYVFEFKVRKSAGEAMDQIHEKEYWKKFAVSGKRIFLIAANFNPKTHALDDILIEEPD